MAFNKKKYMKKYFKENRMNWNRYQRKLKSKKRGDDRNAIVKETFEIVEKDWGFTEKNLSRTAALTLVFSMLARIRHPFYIAKYLSIKRDEVIRVFENWKESGHWDGKYFILENTDSELEEDMQFIMMSLVGGGELVCKTVKKETP